MQLHITNLRVHFYFDDAPVKSPVPSASRRQFAARLSVDQLKVLAADVTWRPGFLRPEDTANRRRIDVTGLWVSFERACATYPGPGHGSSTSMPGISTGRRPQYAKSGESDPCM